MPACEYEHAVTKGLTMATKTLAPELLNQMDAYWRAANYLSVGQIYLFDNPLLKRPLALTDIKHMLLGHWGTTPGQNFIYVHLNRVIKKYDLNMIYVSGPGHGGPAVVGNTYLEETYSEIYPEISRFAKTLQAVFISRRHSQPRLAGMSRLDSRRRRVGVFIESFLRGGVRQSRSDCRLLRWRW
jgi:phosphoketolase